MADLVGISSGASVMAFPAGGDWAVRRSGSGRALATGLTRGDAWREARRLARGAGCRAYLFDKNGRIITRNDYGAAGDG